MSVSNWMSWEGGVDLVAVTDPSYTTPNVIVHVARISESIEVRNLRFSSFIQQHPYEGRTDESSPAGHEDFTRFLSQSVVAPQAPVLISTNQ